MAALDNHVLKLFEANSARLCSELGRCTVALLWSDVLNIPRSTGGRPVDRFGLRAHGATGFLIRTKGCLLWITAGHVLRDIEAGLRNAGDRHLLDFALADGIHTNQAHPAVPFRLRDSPRFFVYDDDLGLDYAAVAVQAHEARLLGACDTAPVRRSAWAKKHEKFDLYCFLGFPRSHRDIVVSNRQVAYSMIAPLIPVAEEDSPPNEMVKPCRRFIGRILSLYGNFDGQPMAIEDIGGMSGGPLFGVRFVDDRLEYRLGAVQSGWMKPDQTIAACPIKPFATVVGRHMEKWLQAAG